VVVANSFDAIKHLVGNGFGVSVISELAVRDELRSGQLVAATMKEGEIMRDINFICMPQDNLRFAEDFIAFCRAEQRNIASPTN